jgi:peptide/nickel transport system ATP-binding protein
VTAVEASLRRVPGGAQPPVLSLRDVVVEYDTDAPVRAVRGVSLDIAPGEVVGIAGESGCGKSTLAYAMTRLLRPPGAVTAGSVTFHATDSDEDIDVLALRHQELRAFRWARIAMVFQSAMSALNPVVTIERQLADVFPAHGVHLSRRQTHERCAELLELVGIDRSRLSAFPHELSGGMRQRVMIAMALTLQPDVIILDEPTTALDVVVQREILSEINRLRALFGFAVVFISDHIAIMYAGRIVEYGPAETILHAPRHPYTVGLIDSFPSLRGARRELRGIPGSPPDLSRPVPGCAFAPRCRHSFEPCSTVDPVLRIPDRADRAAGDTNPERTVSPASSLSSVACHLHDIAFRPQGPPADLHLPEHPSAAEEALAALAGPDGGPVGLAGAVR